MPGTVQGTEDIIANKTDWVSFLMKYEILATVKLGGSLHRLWG